MASMSEFPGDSPLSSFFGTAGDLPTVLGASAERGRASQHMCRMADT